MSDRAADFANRASERVAETADALRGASNEPLGRAGEMISADRMRDAGTQTYDWIEDTVSRNPLVVGAIGLAIGGVIAAALPGTPQERQFLGSASRDVKRRAQEAAAAGVDRAKTVAADIYREAMTTAEEQGLSAEGLRDAASEVADKVRTVATGAMGGQSQTQEKGNPPYQPNNIISTSGG
jgi:hypothetical protein